MNISQRKIILCLFSLILFEPDGIKYFSYIDAFYKILRIGIYVYLLLWSVLRYCTNTSKIKREELLILLFSIGPSLVIAYTSFLNDGQTGYMINKILIYAFVCIYVYYGYNCNHKYFLESTCTALKIYTFINLILMLLLPGGLTKAYIDGNEYLSRWILGAKNDGVPFYIAVLMLQFYLSFNKNKKSGYWVLWFVCMLQVILAKSSTGIMALIATGIISFVISPKILKLINKIDINLNKAVLLGYVLTLIITLTDKLMGALLAINGIFSKVLFMSGRNFIWEKAYYYILKSPMLGYGFENSEIMKTKFGGAAASHCHNMYIDIQYRGGILATVAFVVFWLYLAKKIKTNIVEKNDYSFVVMMMHFILFPILLFQVEAYFDLKIFYLCASVLYSESIILHNNRKRGYI